MTWLDVLQSVTFPKSFIIINKISQKCQQLQNKTDRILTDKQQLANKIKNKHHVMSTNNRIVQNTIELQFNL